MAPREVEEVGTPAPPAPVGDARPTNAATPGGMTMARAALLGAASTVGSVLLSIARSKVAAVVLQPEGLGRATEVMNLVVLANTPAGMLTGPALVGAAARAHAADDRATLSAVYSTALWGSLAASSVGGVAAVVAGFWVLPRAWGPGAWALTALAALASVLLALGAVLGQLLTAFGRLHRVLWAGLASAALSTVCVVGGTLWRGLVGQFVGALVAAALTVPLAFVIARPALPGVRLIPRAVLDRRFLREALTVGVASLAAAVALQGSLLAVRRVLDHHGGAALAGQFQAAWAIGMMAFGLVTAALGNYAFPRYAAAVDGAALTAEVDAALRFVLRVVPPVVLAGMALRAVAIRVLYSHRFDAAIDLLGYQMAADVLRAVAWVYAGPLLYRGRVRAYVLAEALGAALMAALPAVLVPRLGLIGVGVGFYVTDAVYLALSVWLAARTCGVRVDRRRIAVTYALGAAGFAVLLLTDRFLLARAAALALAIAWWARIGLISSVWRRARRLVRRVSGRPDA